MHRVFVYGTLKRGFENHGLLGASTFIDEASTLTPYRMLDGKFPVLRDAGPDRMCIAGELYDVDAQTLKALDELEGVAEGMYDRIEIEVSCRNQHSSGRDTCKAFIYVGCGEYWDHRGRKSCCSLDARGHIDWPLPLPDQQTR